MAIINVFKYLIPVSFCKDSDWFVITNFQFFCSDYNSFCYFHKTEFKVWLTFGEGNILIIVVIFLKVPGRFNESMYISLDNHT